MQMPGITVIGLGFRGRSTRFLGSQFSGNESPFFGLFSVSLGLISAAVVSGGWVDCLASSILQLTTPLIMTKKTEHDDVW